MYTYKNINYRGATKKDIPGLSYFLRNIIDENDLTKDFDADMASGSETLLNLIKSNRGVTLLAEFNDKIVGCIILGKMHFWWADPNKEVFTNLAIYVDPAFRKGYRVQDTLLELTKSFADNAGTPVVLNLYDATDKKLKVLKYLNRKKFETIGVTALYRPTPKV